MKFLILSTLLLLTTAISAKQWPSAIRKEGTDYQTIMRKADKGYYSYGSAVKLATDYDKFTAPEITPWENSHEVMEAFTTARDLRFIDWTYLSQDFPRRSTWLYPDDGCYLRAELITKNLEDRGYENLYKVFAFGNLKVNTNNHPRGYVSWWYHVVPIIAHGDDYLVFDPAINPEAPMTLRSWLSTMDRNVANIEVAICDAHAVGPYDSCQNPNEEDTDDIIYQQSRLLHTEWRRVQSLNRDPYQELGDNPPWSM